MFGLRVLRVRNFESNVMLIAPSMPKKRGGTSKGYSRLSDAEYLTVAGHNFSYKDAVIAMGIDWMQTRYEIAQSIPPAYTEYIGKQLMAHAQITKSPL